MLVLISITKKCVKTPDAYFKGVGYIYREFMNIYIINGDQQYFLKNLKTSLVNKDCLSNMSS